MTRPTKVLGYTRVSTHEQEHTGHGLAAQQQRIQEACERRGWQLQTIREQGSGRDLHRPGLQDALTLLAERKADGLVVAKMDRLSRSLIDFALLLDWFRDSPAFFVALDFDLDTSTPTGELMAQMLVMIAQWERRAIGQRTKDALEELRQQGRPVNQGCIPVEVVERIHGLRDEGQTLRAICAALNEDQVPTARGGVWAPGTVLGVLGRVRRPARRRQAVLPEVKRS